jgi:hypothetical protein
LAVPETAQVLLLEGDQNTSFVGTLNVRVEPKNAAVRIYLPEVDCQLLCKAPGRQITIESRSGQIIVDKSDSNARVEITVVSRG